MDSEFQNLFLTLLNQGDKLINRLELYEWRKKTSLRRHVKKRENLFLYAHPLGIFTVSGFFTNNRNARDAGLNSNVFKFSSITIPTLRSLGYDDRFDFWRGAACTGAGVGVAQAERVRAAKNAMNSDRIKRSISRGFGNTLSYFNISDSF
jgi:hypothetical protein